MQRRFYIHPTKLEWLVVTPGKATARRFRRAANGRWRVTASKAAESFRFLPTQGRLVPVFVKRYG